jgi:hypothetical protein
MFELLLLGVIVFLVMRASKHTRRFDERHDKLAAEIGALAARIARLEGLAPPAAEREIPMAESSSRAVAKPTPFARIFEVQPATWSAEQVAPTAGFPVPHPQKSGIEAQPSRELPPAPLPAPSVLAQRWQRFERMFVENWTGILGATLLVAGVAFLAIYAALQVAPFHRFLMTLGGAAVLFALGFAAQRRSAWQALSQWLRSAAAAVLLFACAASGGLPGLGMQWLYEPVPALGLLLAGLSVNVAAAWLSRAQTFAALHVVLSLLPLLLAPPSIVSLAIGTAVAAIGIALAVKARWDVHVLAVVAAYAAFHVVWYFRMGGQTAETTARAVGLLCVIAVFAAAALVHYRRDYASSRVETLPLIVHIGNWMLLALAALVYAHDLTLGSAALAVGAGAAWMLGRRGQALGIRWVHVSDMLIGQALAVGSIVCVYDLFAGSWLLLLLAVFVECALFLRVVLDQPEKILGRVAFYAAHASALALGLAGLPGALGGGPTAGSQTGDGLVLLAGTAVAALLQGYLGVARRERITALAPYGADAERVAFAQQGSGWLAGVLVAVAVMRLSAQWWVAATALGASATLLVAARALRDTGLTVAATAGILTGHLVVWGGLIHSMPWNPLPLTLRWVPLVALAVLPLVAISRTWLRNLAAALTAADLALGAYLYLHPTSPLLPGVAWLMLSLLALEVANRVRVEALVTLIAGYAYLAAFAASYALVVLQTQAYLGAVPARVLIEAFAIAVLGYWWFHRPSEHMGSLTTWLRVHPLVLEAALALAAAGVLADVPTEWRPTVWALLGIALNSTSGGALFGSRCRLYGLIFYWTSVAAVAFVMTGFENPSLHWFLRPDALSVLAISVQTVFIVAFARVPSKPGVEFPVGLSFLGRLAALVDNRPRLWVFYPYFAGIALFLFWRFDRSVLTLLWSAEAFVVFVLSALLRESQFRFVALAGLAACLLRLVAIDLAEANLGIRGLVFLGVGLLMLGMNAIYTRYRERFE